MAEENRMHFAGYIACVFGGGAAGYLYGSYVERKAQAAMAAAKAAVDAVKKA